MSFLESIFGPYTSTIWKEIADDLNAKFIRGKFYENSIIIFSYNNWNIQLTLGSKKIGKNIVTTTLFTADYIELSKFNLKLSEEYLLSSVDKFFGMQDVEIGDKLFDDKFIIKGNDIDKVISFFDTEEIKQILMRKSGIELEIGHFSTWSSSMKEGSKRVKFEKIGEIIEKKEIQLLLLFITIVLDRLVELDIASNKI